MVFGEYLAHAYIAVDASTTMLYKESGDLKMGFKYPECMAIISL